MRVLLTKISPTQHRFEYMREDGSGESVELETKSFLLHDLIHFAVETEAKLDRSFYGLLARGFSYEELTMDMEELGEEIVHVEHVVGPLTQVIKGEVSTQECLHGIRNLYAAYRASALPPWLTEEFLERVAKRMQKLLGEWRGTTFGKTMELTFTY